MDEETLKVIEAWKTDQKKEADAEKERIIAKALSSPEGKAAFIRCLSEGLVEEQTRREIMRNGFLE